MAAERPVGSTDVNTKYQKLFADRVTERTNGAITISKSPDRRS